MEAHVVEGIDIFGVLKYFNPDLELDTFLVATQLVICVYFLSWNLFSGVTLALLSPVNPELTYRSVQSFPTNITYGAGGSDRVIKFGTLVTFCVLIYSLGNVISPHILFSDTWAVIVIGTFQVPSCTVRYRCTTYILGGYRCTNYIHDSTAVHKNQCHNYSLSLVPSGQHGETVYQTQITSKMDVMLCTSKLSKAQRRDADRLVAAGSRVYFKAAIVSAQ